MPTQIEENVITLKTRELCQAILEQPDVRAMRQKIDVFLANDQVRGQYDALMMKGQMLQQKQQSGMPLDRAEIDAFEQLRETFLSNPVAKGFLDAQEDMHKVQQSVANYVTKTFELGRVPEESELDSGSCGEGCGCHH
ncbi:MAG TPA: YlbF family regulator [Verrucomicrobiae bacterium]|nr:YlbF family regulator [Verrucomicrobiae bacterium]